MEIARRAGLGIGSFVILAALASVARSPAAEARTEEVLQRIEERRLQRVAREKKLPAPSWCDPTYGRFQIVVNEFLYRDDIEYRNASDAYALRKRKLGAARAGWQPAPADSCSMAWGIAEHGEIVVRDGDGYVELPLDPERVRMAEYLVDWLDDLELSCGAMSTFPSTIHGDTVTARMGTRGAPPGMRLPRDEIV